MLNHLRNLAVFLDGTPASDKLGAYAAGLAHRHGAHLIGIYGIPSAEAGHSEYGYARGSAAIHAMMELQKTRNEENILAAGRHFAALARTHEISSEFRFFWTDQARDDVFLQTLHADLVLLGHPKLHGMPEGWTADRLLRVTGVPVLLVPEGWQGNSLGDHLLIGWNASRQARRAIVDAMPLIALAKSVTVLVVDADNGEHPYGPEAGADIALVLARHGARVEVAQVKSEGEPIGDVILANVAKETDLVMIGARSHARSTEILFGGVTRTLLAKSTIPLFMSR